MEFLSWLIPVVYALIGVVIAAPAARMVYRDLGSPGELGDVVLMSLLIGLLVILMAGLWPLISFGWLFWFIVKPRTI